MATRFLSALAAVALLCCVAAPAMAAQSTSVSHMASKADVGRFSVKDVADGIGAPSTLAALAQLTPSADIKFIELHTLRGYTPAGPRFSKAQNAGLAALRKAIKQNATLAAAIRHAGFLLDDVVGVVVDASGNALVFINL